MGTLPSSAHTALLWAGLSLLPQLRASSGYSTTPILYCTRGYVTLGAGGVDPGLTAPSCYSFYLSWLLYRDSTWVAKP